MFGIFLIFLCRIKPMEIPEKADIYKTPLSVQWFDEEGIFCSVTNKNIEITREELVTVFTYIKSQSGGKKICWLGDISMANSADKETREFAAEITPSLVEALALVTDSPVSRMLGNLFIGLQKPAYPVKLFTNETEARKWLRNYIS